MENHALFCKSFREDFYRLDRLIKSSDFGEGSTKLLVSVPRQDLDMIKGELNLPSFVTVVCDEDYTVAGEQFQYGWLQQQVCKLSVYRTRFAASYLCLDSDTYLIKPISKDVFHTAGIPNIIHSPVHTKYYPGNTFLLDYIHERVFVPPRLVKFGSTGAFSDRLEFIRAKIRDEMTPEERGIFIEELFQSHSVALQPGQIFHDDIMIKMEKFLTENELSFYDIIRLSPWEYNWYGLYAASNMEIDVVGISSPIVHFASDEAVHDAKRNGVTVDGLQRNFNAVQMAARHFETLEF